MMPQRTVLPMEADYARLCNGWYSNRFFMRRRKSTVGVPTVAQVETRSGAPVRSRVLGALVVARAGAVAADVFLRAVDLVVARAGALRVGRRRDRQVVAGGFTGADLAGERVVAARVGVGGGVGALCVAPGRDVGVALDDRAFADPSRAADLAHAALVAALRGDDLDLAGAPLGDGRVELVGGAVALVCADVLVGPALRDAAAAEADADDVGVHVPAAAGAGPAVGAAGAAGAVAVVLVGRGLGRAAVG